MDKNGKPIKLGTWYKMNVLRGNLTETQYEKQVKRFGVNTVGILIHKSGDLFEYSDGDSIKQFDQPCTFEPISLFRKLSLSYSYQGSEGTCFAHGASLMIFHNLYKLSLTEKEKRVYIENDCNLHLDTTREVEEYKLIRSQCGESGTTRILLFLYIYKVLTHKFGCDGGNIDKSILYYLNTSFQPIFSREVNRILMPIYESVHKESFECSMVDIKGLPPRYKDYLSDYFERYYAVADIIQPSHSVALVGINKFGVLGKDSATSTAFIIPFHAFRSKGSFSIKDDNYKGIDYLYFLYKKSKVYPNPFKTMLNENSIHLDTYPELNADIEKEREKEKERKTRKVKQEARLEKIVSEALRKSKTRKRYI